MEGKNADPKLTPVNPAAAAQNSKPKLQVSPPPIPLLYVFQVAKKANILNQLAPTAAEQAPSRSPEPERTMYVHFLPSLL